MIKYVIMLQMITLLANLMWQLQAHREKWKYASIILSALTALAATWFMVQQWIAPHSEYAPFYSFLENPSCEFGLLSDSLSAIAAWVICTITAIANYYSTGYIRKNIAIFLTQINSLSLAAIMVATANNLLQLYAFWVILTVISCFLADFDKKKTSLKTISKMANLHLFGDIGFILSMAALFHMWGNLNFDENLFVGNDMQLKKFEFISLLMLLSVFVKFAQIGPSRWLEEAIWSMPIPATVLIHSVALLPAGTILIIRLQNLFECSEFIQHAIVWIGLLSTLFYSLRAVFAGSLQKILAYSTIAQAGSMTVACGFSAYGAAIALFVSHAFSKAALIFAIGSVIHALSGERDIKCMGGLFEWLPKTYIVSILTIASMVGVPLTPFYYSRKILLNEVLGVHSSSVLISCTIITIVFSSILASAYFFRIFYLIFHGEIKLTETGLAYLSEQNPPIIYSMYAAVFFAIFSGVFFYYALYNDVIWADVFVFSYGEGPSAVFMFTIANIAGLCGAGLICKSIKPITIPFKFRLNFKINIKRLRSINEIDRRFFKKFYLFITNKNRRNHADK
ncbi:MAG: hypothetical protein LBS14_01000 [Holosporaceae bacterium]|jgi:NADH-quinone oxidoreductase subunit L|nr:hypothetical protein [Holosporaceae bacterium]